MLLLFYVPSGWYAKRYERHVGKDLIVYEDLLRGNDTLVPKKTFRKFVQMSAFSRLTSVEKETGKVVEDILLSGGCWRGSLLIYNIQGADTIRVDHPPAY